MCGLVGLSVGGCQSKTLGANLSHLRVTACHIRSFHLNATVIQIRLPTPFLLSSNNIQCVLHLRRALISANKWVLNGSRVFPAHMAHPRHLLVLAHSVSKSKSGLPSLALSPKTTRMTPMIPERHRSSLVTSTLNCFPLVSRLYLEPDFGMAIVNVWMNKSSYGTLALNVLGSLTDVRGIGYWGTGIRKSGGNNRHQRRCGRNVRVFAFTSWGYKLTKIIAFLGNRLSTCKRWDGLYVRFR